MDRSNSFGCLKYTLISVNLMGMVVGFGGFVTGLAKPDLLVSSEVSGAQLTLCSLFLLFISLIGFVGALREHLYLLLIYGVFILLSFLLRILWLVTSYWHRGETFILDANIASSIMSAIIKLMIMLFAFLEAHAIRRNVISDEKTRKKNHNKNKNVKYIDVKNPA